MTKKQRFEEVFSISGVDVPCDNSHILEKKKDIQKNVEKILKLIEEGNDAKSEAVSLIKYFHEGYEDLCDQYGQLIESLKKETEKRGRDSLNDSKSEEHSKGDKPQLSSKNAGSLLEKVKLNLTLDAAEIEEAVDQMMAAAEKEKENLKLANTSLSNKVKEDEAVIDHLITTAEDLRKHLEAKEEEVCSLNSQFEDEGQELVTKLIDLQIEQCELSAECNQLKHELDTTRNDASVMKQKLEAARGEYLKNIDALNAANSTVKELENKLKQLRDENSILSQSKIKLEEAEKIADSYRAEIQQLRDANSKLLVDLGAAIRKQGKVISHLDDQEKENMELCGVTNMSASEVSPAETKIRNLESELEQMRKEASTLQQSEEDSYRKNSDVESRFKPTQERLDEKTTDAHKVQKEPHLLSTQKSEVEEEAKKLEQSCLEYKLLMKNLEEALARKIVAQETRLSHLQCWISELVVIYKQQKDALKEIFVQNHAMKLERDFKNHAEKLKLETVELSSENEELSCENRNLNLKVGPAEEEKGSLQSEIMTAAKGVREDESTIDIPAIDSSDHLNEQTKAKEDEAHSLDSPEEYAEGKFYKAYEKMKEELMKLTAEYEIVLDKLDERETLLEKLEDRELSKVKRTLDATKRENSENLQKLKKAERTVKEQEQKMKQLRDENSVLKQSKTRRKGAEKIADDSGKAEQLSSENESLILKLQAAEGEKRGLRLDIAIADEKLREAESTIKKLAVESEQLKEQLKAREDERTELLAKCEKDASNLEAANGEDAKIVDELKKENSTLRELEKRLKQLRDENSVLGQIKIKLKEADLLSAQKNKAEEEVRKLEKSSKELARKLELRETENAGARKEIAKLCGECRRFKSHVLRRNQTLARIEKELQSLRQQSDQDCERLSSLAAQQYGQRKGDAENEKNEQERAG